MPWLPRDPELCPGLSGTAEDGASTVTLPLTGRPECVPSSWLWPGPALTVLGIWRMNRWLAGLWHCVSLPSYDFAFQISKIILFKNVF